ncbi:MAG TPA: magnesium/cobalt transporter CorA [Candidatus Saccharimonadales bacterium]|nr:magnesium/cobalt transporter CorA [Candidatus Saccharimonadales bacterium]
MIQSLLIHRGKLESDLAPERIAAFLGKPEGMLWIDLEAPTKKEIAILSDVFGFHPLAIEDATKESDLPKAGLYEGYAHLVIHRIPVETTSWEEMEPREMDLFLSERYVVTVHDSASISVQETAAKLRTAPEGFEAGADRVMYEILDRVVDRYTPLLDQWDDAVDELEVEILGGAVEDGVLDRALHLRRAMADLRKSLGPQRELIERLARRQVPYVSEQVIPYMRDVLDHMTRLFQTLESLRDHISFLFEAHMAISSNNLSHVMKRLTLIATIFLPLSFIAGVYGMNFSHIPGLQNPYGFAAVMILMGGLAVTMLWYFKRRGLW